MNIGDRIDGKYRIVSYIGTGGMAEIFEAHDLIKKKTCVLKVMLSDLTNNLTNLERFEREAKIESNFTHPNIVKIFGYGEIEGRPYYVMELIKGQTIREKIDFKYSFSLRETLDIINKVAEALSYIHKRGIVHADIKPDNIYILQNGDIKISDFGVAYDENEQGVKKQVIGSVFYIAPEITLSKEYSPESDIYALGITLYEMITGHVPFEKADPIETALAHTKENIPTINDVDSNVPKEIDILIAKCCDKNPENRFHDALEICNEIKKIIDENKINKKKRSFFSRLFGFKE